MTTGYDADGRPRRRRIMDKFALGEVSFVSRPAQEGATAAIIKSDDGTDAEKNGDLVDLVSGSEDGHQHGISICEYHDEHLSLVVHYAAGPDGEMHDHQLALGTDGQYAMTENRGHTHEIDSAQLQLRVMSEMMKTADEAELDGPDLGKVTFTAEQRRQMARSGVALPDGSFPIRNAGDLGNAVRAFGRTAAGKRRQVANHIKRRARALGLTDRLPTEGVLADLLKSENDDPGEQTGHEEDTMTISETEDKTAEERFAALETENATLKAVNALSPTHKAHYDAMDAELDDPSAFLAMTSEQRDAEVAKAAEKAADTNPVIFTDVDGNEYRKNDDPRLVSMAKGRDEDRKDAIKARVTTENADLEKRATDDLANFPGDVDTRKAILKAVDGIKDEAVRSAAHDALKAQNAKMAKAFETIGSSDGTTAVVAKDASRVEAEDELDRLAKAHAEKEGVDFYTAYEVVSQENADLLSKAVGVIA